MQVTIVSTKIPEVINETSTWWNPLTNELSRFVGAQSLIGGHWEIMPGMQPDFSEMVNNEVRKNKNDRDIKLGDLVFPVDQCPKCHAVLKGYVTTHTERGFDVNRNPIITGFCRCGTGYPMGFVGNTTEIRLEGGSASSGDVILGAEASLDFKDQDAVKAEDEAGVGKPKRAYKKHKKRKVKRAVASGQLE